MFAPTKSLLFVFLALAGGGAQSGTEAPHSAQSKSGTEAPHAAQSKKSVGHQRQPETKKTAAETSVEATAPQPVPIPLLAPEELPAGAPRVTYQNGRLSVDSNNSTLDEVLKAIGAETGADIESLPNTSGERVAAHLSGAPRSVIASLLDGANFGYVIQSPASDPDAVVRVVLSNQTQGDGRPEPAPAAAFSHRRLGAVPQAETNPSAPYTASTAVSADRVAGADAVPQPTSSNAQIAANPMPAAAAGGTLSETAMADPSSQPTGAQGSGEGQQVPENAPLAPSQGRTAADTLQDMYRQRQLLQPQNQQPKSQNE